jgi:Lipoprotein NlpI, contains TPR repeats
MPKLLVILLLAAASLQLSQSVFAQLPGNQRAGDEQPIDATVLHQRAVKYFAQNDLNRALEDLHAAIRINPYYTPAYFLRGQIFARNKDFTKAVADFNSVIAQDASTAEVFHQRALAFQGSRDYRQALDDFNKALALEPRNALLLRDRAMVHRDGGNYDQAVDDYEEAMRLGFSAVDPHPLGELLFYQGRFHQSAQTLQQVVRTRPDNRHAALWRYLALGKANDDRSAARELADLAARAATDKRWPAAVFEFYLGKIDESSLYAATDAADEMMKSEQQCQAYFYVAEARLLKGAKEDAISRLQVAKNQCPPNTAFFHGANAELKRFGH